MNLSPPHRRLPRGRHEPYSPTRQVDLTTPEDVLSGLPPELAPWTPVLLRGGDGPPRPAWLAADAPAILDALASSSRAVAYGQLFARGADGAREVSQRPGIHVGDLLGADSAWACRREPGEDWATYAERSIALARRRVKRLVRGADAPADTEIVVDLRWVTQETMSLFDIPQLAERALEECLVRGEPLWPALQEHQLPVAARSHAVDGSFHGFRAMQLDAVPLDARYLEVDGRAPGFERIAGFRRLEFLTVGRVNQKVLTVVGNLRTLRVLCLDEVRARDLSALSGLAKLQYLRCSPARPDLDISALAKQPKLQGLALDARAGPSNLSVLARLRRLQTLELLTGGPGAPGRLPTLKPLSNLTNLRWLYLGYMRVDDLSLRPLTALRALRRLELHSSFPVAEFAALARALPHVEPDVKTPFQQLPGLMGSALLYGCRKCGRHTKLLTREKPARRLCPECNARKVREYVADWELRLASPS